MTPDPGLFIRNVIGLGYFFLGALWLLMRKAGVRKDEDHFSMKRTNQLLMITGMLAVMILAPFFVLRDLREMVIVPHLVALTPTLILVPVAIFFAWFKFRLELIDIIFKQMLYFIIIVFAAWALAFMLPQASEGQRIYVMLTTFLFAALLLSKVKGWLESLWMPQQMDREQFNTVLPNKLASCVTPQQAINETENVLSTLFNTDIVINRPLKETAQTIKVNDKLQLQLGYVRGSYPWFSEGLNLVRTAAMHLNAHLKVLAALEEKRQQTIISQQLSELAVKAELGALRAQIKPHFLFNVLNSIHSLIKDDPDHAEQTIELLASFMRDSLSGGESDTCAVAKKIAMANTYLEIEKIRYGKRLNFDINMQAGTEDLQIPMFSLQPLVENAVKHAVDQSTRSTHILIDAYQEAESLYLKVSDDGPGLYRYLQRKNSEMGLGMALDNIRDRLHRLYGQRAQLTLTDGPSGGVTATLLLPLADEITAMTPESSKDGFNTLT